MRKPFYAPVGEFSSGTMRDEDVGEALADMVRPLSLSWPERRIVRDWDKLMAQEEQDADELADVCQELWEVLESHCPPYTYAGAIEGDGACYGVWPMMDADDVPRYGAGESPLGSDDCFEVTDHGNVSCGRRARNGRWVEHWSVA